MDVKKSRPPTRQGLCFDAAHKQPRQLKLQQATQQHKKADTVLDCALPITYPTTFIVYTCCSYPSQRLPRLETRLLTTVQVFLCLHLHR
jgi:hypothetical protein